MNKVGLARKEKILNAAIKAFAGSEATITDISNMSGVPKPSVFYYYNTRLELYRAVIEICKKKERRIHLEVLARRAFNCKDYETARNLLNEILEW